LGSEGAVGEIKPLYRALMLETVALAERAGRITTAQAGKLRKALG
jgi:hypothetical protein